VFDIDDGHRFVRRIPARGVDENGKPLNVKGACASASTGRLYVSTLRFLTCYDLLTDEVLWERAYEGGCDRMAITPNGKAIYLPSLEGPHWHVVDAASGDVIAKVVPDSGAHNTIVGGDGRHAYLAGLRSPEVSVVDTATNVVVRKIGPFGAPVRPFTIDGSQSRLFACVNDRLGFEVGDARTGKVLAAVSVEGFAKGPVKRHGCPSHGVALSPDERTLWVTDAANKHLHVYDPAAMPPRKLASVPLRDEPGWVTFSLDGKYAYPSTGEVIDAETREVVTQLTDEEGRLVQSEKMLEIDFAGGRPVRANDQFGMGRVAANVAPGPGEGRSPRSVSP
jgi:YVTN family beta-propeller protein